MSESFPLEDPPRPPPLPAPERLPAPPEQSLAAFRWFWWLVPAAAGLIFVLAGVVMLARNGLFQSSTPAEAVPYLPPPAAPQRVVEKPQQSEKEKERLTPSVTAPARTDPEPPRTNPRPAPVPTPPPAPVTLVTTLAGQRNAQGCVALSPDGRLVATGGADQMVRVAAVADGKEQVVLHHQSRFAGRGANVVWTAFSPNSRSVASIAETTIKVWDLASGKERYTLEPEFHYPQCAAFSADGNWLATGGLSTVLLWSAKDGKRQGAVGSNLNHVCDLAFRPDGRMLAIACDNGTVQVVELPSGRTTLSVRGHNLKWNAVYVAFSPDGRWLAAGSWQQVFVWDVATGQLAHTLVNQQAYIRSLTFAPDSKRLAVSTTRKVALWDVPSETIVHVFAESGDNVGAMVFTGDGGRFTAGGRDRSLHVWDIPGLK